MSSNTVISLTPVFDLICYAIVSAPRYVINDVEQ